jgi:hypothetical protein
MVGILIDLRTGDPVIGDDGDYIQVDDNYAFYQIITQLLNCQVGTEIWNLYYGFDLEEAITLNSQGVPAQVIESLVADALDPAKESLIFTVDYIKGERDGQEMNVKISVKSRLGTLVNLSTTIGESL